ncbi:gliding motility-associated ABC transporter permease subunit GldF [Geofilum sp. OHC36d9]|uniref:gliding motility-associated ABC transporter permease subunit GldF n=1 Tax=Geofilum sp. OHC36d9 TaxID=3458413 RepID=UPI004034A7FB
MFALYRKEVVLFFSTITGYLVAGLFLLLTALFLWVLPGDLNIPQGGYAVLDSFFWLAPWLYLFFIPAVTMRLLAEEKRSGTMELLLTHPLSDWHIIFAKFLAGFTVVGVSLIPTLVYFFSVYHMAQPLGNVDMGAIWGSYIGLFLLAAVYTAIGLFTSSLTSNQIVAFLLAALVSFVLYTGFQTVAQISLMKPVGSLLVNMGIDEHYSSISRGVVDSRDIIYFLSVIALFLSFTRIVIARRRW